MRKQVFRDALERKRCLVPADGFFEWKQRDGKDVAPQPMCDPSRAAPASSRSPACGRARRPTRREVHSFTIITGPPNELVTPIHDRMPVVLDRERVGRVARSLAAGGGRPRAARRAPARGWRAEPVSTWVNTADHDDERCIASPAAPAQGTLF